MNLNVRKRTFRHVRPTKTQISLRIHEVWSESSLSAWRNFVSLAIQNAFSEDSDQTARMRRLIWILTGRTSEDTFSDVAANVKGVLTYARTAKDQIRLCIYTVLSGPSLFAFKQPGYVLSTGEKRSSRKHAYIVLTPFSYFCLFPRRS